MNVELFRQVLIENGRQWIESERARHRPGAKSISQLARTEFMPFFESDALNRSRVKIVPVIENPAFYSNISDIGIPLLDFSMMSGITFVDIILISQKHMPTDSQLLPLLFHELVHVAQYKALGSHAFVSRYVRGWAANGFDYFAIPLERDAYELEAVYKEDPGTIFSVEAEVRRRIAL